MSAPPSWAYDRCPVRCRLGDLSGTEGFLHKSPVYGSNDFVWYYMIDRSYRIGGPLSVVDWGNLYPIDGPSESPPEPAKPQWNGVCPRCGAEAYLGFVSVECSRLCTPETGAPSELVEARKKADKAFWALAQ